MLTWERSTKSANQEAADTEEIFRIDVFDLDRNRPRSNAHKATWYGKLRKV